MSNSMSSPAIAVVILAAGKGSRMKSALPKVLHPIGNAPMLHHAMRSAEALQARRTVVVVGHGAEAVETAATARNPDVRIAHQTEQKGTGHAVLMAAPALEGFSGDLLVLYGDTPFLSDETLARVIEARRTADVVVLGFEAADPGRYGRLVTDEDGALSAIVEAKDASPETLAITLCNSGVMAGDASTMLDLLGRLSPVNAQGEYYLTDVVALARAAGLQCRAVVCAEHETLGINDRIQLAEAEAVFQARARETAMAEGATLVDPATVHLSMDTQLGRDVIVHPHVVFGPGVVVGDGSEIKSFTHLEATTLASDVKVGPFARMRGGNRLESGVRVGNFVELKAATLGEGTKAGHLTYLGDATLGAGVNIGAGTITCNYDGVLKHQTTLGDGVFIGVNNALVAPITIGDGAYTGTGSVLTEDVPADAFAIARTKQVTRPGLAQRLRAQLAARARKHGKS